MKKFPKWFWISIITFIIVSWAAIPISAYFTEHARYVARTVVSIGLFAYPVFFVIMMLILFKKTKLDSNEKIWGFYFMLIPILVYFPFWSIITQ